jgi:heme A synthase
VRQRGEPGRTSQAAFQIVAAAAIVAAFGQVALGGVVRVTGSGLGCPDWPLCHGRIIPPMELATIIEYSHRVSATAVGVLVLATAILALRAYRRDGRVLIPSVLGLGLVVAAGALGGITVLTELTWWVRSIHLAIAEALLASMIVALVAARAQGAPEGSSSESRRFNLLVLATAAATLGLILSGSYMVGYGAGSSCATWPLCRGSLLPEGGASLVHMAHRYASALVGILIVFTSAAAWSRRAQRPQLGWAAAALILAFAVQIVVGAATVMAGFSIDLRAIHLSVATLVWMMVTLLAVLVLLPQMHTAGESPDRGFSLGRAAL